MLETRSISSETLADLKAIAESSSFQGNSSVQWRKDVLEAFFVEPGDVHQLLISVNRNLLSNGYTFRISTFELNIIFEVSK